MYTKLTLRLDDGLIAQAKAYAKRRGKSISQMVGDYFRVLGRPSALNGPILTPLVRSLRGSLRGRRVDIRGFKRHLESKHL